MQKKIKRAILFYAITMLTSCSTKNYDCKKWLYNKVLEIKMPSIEKKIKKAKGKIVKEINQQIKQLPSFQKIIVVENKAIPKPLKVSILLSSSKTKIKELQENDLDIQNPRFDSSCRNLTLATQITFEGTIRTPIKINNVTPYNYKKERFKCYLNPINTIKYLISSKDQCQRPTISIHALTMKPTIRFTFNLTLNINPFKKTFFISPCSENDVKIIYQCNNEIPKDLKILGRNIQSIDHLTEKAGIYQKWLKDFFNSSPELITAKNFIKVLWTLPQTKPISSNLSNTITDIANEQCDKQFKNKDIKRTIVKEINTHLQALKGALPS